MRSDSWIPTLRFGIGKDLVLTSGCAAASLPRALHVLTASSAAARLAEARASFTPGGADRDRLIVAPSRDAADDFARSLLAGRTALVGLRRASLLELVVKLAGPGLVAEGLTTGTAAGIDAIVARTVGAVAAEGRLSYLAPIAFRPGFRRALGRTLADVRLAGVAPEALHDAPRTGPDLAILAARHEAELRRARIADHATLLRLAAAAAPSSPLVRDVDVLFLDVAVHGRLEAEFVRALAASAGRFTATVPAGDRRTLAFFEALAGHAAMVSSIAGGPAALRLAQTLLFETRPPDAPRAACSGEGVELFSAPGEGREAVEIARRVLAEARGGLRFDRMAILVRAPGLYSPLLETALARAGIPAWFARGVRRPDPAGRAFLALLRAADEDLSARRFAEYLSLGQTPGDGPATAWTAADDEAADAATAGQTSREVEDAAEDEAASTPAWSARPFAPRKWEALLNEAAVIGGRERWQRRLDGLARELTLGIEELERDEPDAPALLARRRTLDELARLRTFAMPIVETLDGWRGADGATWGDWVARLETLAPRVLARPGRVLSTIGALRGLAASGPVPLRDVIDVLGERLGALQVPPRGTRFGRVFVGTPDLARGREFDVVFVPGLSERVFPERARQDPLLLDAARAAISPRLRRDEDRLAEERLRLRLAVGAATRRVYVSYSSLELASARDRVPSFYALDLWRAVTGEIPDHEALARHAAVSSGARLAWPAPPEPAMAIDAAEHDLATLRGLLQAPASARRGRARYLLELHPALARSLRTRYLRWRPAWSVYDGLVLDERTRPLLADFRLRTRAYSPSALQRFAVCPYQFYLSSILRLEPREVAAPVHTLDPLTRGRLMHEVIAGVTRTLALEGVELSATTLGSALAVLDRVVAEVASAYRDALAPPVERVWAEEVAAIRLDLGGWLSRAAEERSEWTPEYVELGVGFPPGPGRDPASVREPAVLPGGWRVHGVIDLVERHRNTGDRRITDFKTGRNSTTREMVVGRGEKLQPVLYGLAIEAALGRPVVESRLWFCTAAGRYSETVVPLTPDVRDARRALGEVLEIVDRALEQGFLPPAPRHGACEYCDFVAVCGPNELRRSARKDPTALGDLTALRSLR